MPDSGLVPAPAAWFGEGEASGEEPSAGVELQFTSSTGTFAVQPGGELTISIAAVAAPVDLSGFQLDFVASADELILNEWTTDSGWTLVLDDTLNTAAVPPDSQLAAASINSRAAPAALGTFRLTAPEVVGDYRLTLEGPAGDPFRTSFVSSTGEVPITDYGDVMVLVRNDDPLGDWGDAPDPSYPTLAASGGAFHSFATDGPRLGYSVDIEADGQPHPEALGDDGDGEDDEDGVRWLSPLVPGQIARLSVRASAPGLLNAWIDWAGNGDWADAVDQVFTDEVLAAGDNIRSITVPQNASLTVPGHPTFARFRFSSQGGLSYAGDAPDGEVEDYAVEIQGPVKEDLVGRAESTGEWWVGRSDGSQFSSSQWGRWSSVTWLDVRSIDVNGDGLSDTVGRYSGDGSWWVAVNTGSGFVNEKWGRWSTGAVWGDVRIGDFNGDTFEDIAGRTDAGDWWIAVSNGLDSFANQLWGHWSSTVTWGDVQVGDFDGDGSDDLAGRVSTSGEWWVAKSNGSSAFSNEKWGRWSAAVTWVDIQPGDFNGDGREDLIGRVASSGEWWVAASEEGARFVNESWSRWSEAVSWIDVRVGDFNGDGCDDIAGRVASSGDWWVAISNGADAFTNVNWGRWATISWNDVTIGDFTGDGRDDIAGRTVGGDWWVARTKPEGGSLNEYWGNWAGSVTWLDVLAAEFAP